MRDRPPVSRSHAILLSVMLIGCASGGPSPIGQAHEPGRADTSLVTVAQATGGFPSGYAVLRNSVDPPAATASGYDILHADVDLSFDFRAVQAFGRVTYRLVVLRQGLAEIRLHAQGLDIDAVDLIRSGRPVIAQYSTTDEFLSVWPPVPLARADTLTVSVSYSASGTAHGTGPGFHFADSRGDDPFLPEQVWAGDELAGASVWIPTWDHPSERMTYLISITVPDSLSTLANGVLEVQEPVGQSDRRDIWSLDVPQPASRMGFAVGDFTWIGDEYESPVGKRFQLLYGVDPELESYADAILAPLPAIMQAIERRTAVEYPFAEYKMATVWSHPAGGAGLAGIALLDRSILRDERARVDDRGEALLTRTLASQWYGSWIVVRDRWDLPLTEGLARLFEWVYLSETERDAEAEEQILRARDRYFDDASQLRRPVILREPTARADSSFAHANNKSALVLLQLGFVIGDDTWWRALRDFTARGAWRVVTLGDLRESMEQAARRPLATYFDQWFLSPGHPELTVHHAYDSDVGIYTMRIRQVQDSVAFPTFVLDTDVEIDFQSRPPYRERIRVSSRDTTLRFGVSGRIAFARLDTKGRLLADIRESKPHDHWLEQVRRDDAVGGRYAAVRHLVAADRSIGTRDALLDVSTSDPSQLVRAAAIRGLEKYIQSGVVMRVVLDRGLADDSPEVRAAAIETLTASGDPSALGVFRRALADSSYQVVAAAVDGLVRLAPESFWTVVRPLTEERSWKGVLDLSILKALWASPDTAAAGYLEDRMEPGNPEAVRLAALAAFRRLATFDRAWKGDVKATVQALVSDRNVRVRNLAREILRDL